MGRATPSGTPLGECRLDSGTTSLRTRGNTVAVGEAIQTGKAFTLDCFAPLATTGGSQ
ncbi:MAG: hypothetical protein LBT00_06855 [Spirochaetaceae bacterium]|nr:hypothetical protein [Spirochaetaceae bacterium]